MTEESKTPETPPQPEIEVKEEEIVEVPVDIGTFQSSIDTALRTLDRAAKTLEGTLAYEKFVEQIRAVIDTTKTIRVEVSQLNELDSVLAAAKFTNKSDVDAKIRKRVIDELSKHFKFTKIGEEVVNADELVVLDVNSTKSADGRVSTINAHSTSSEYKYPSPIRTGMGQTSTQPVVSSSSRSLNDAASREKMRREARAEAMQEAGIPQSAMSIYEKVFEQDTQVVQMEDNVEVNEDNVSPEEAARIFGSESMDPESAARIEALKSKTLPKLLKSGPIARGSNKGISRSK